MERFDIPVHLRVAGRSHDLTLSCRRGSTLAEARAVVLDAIGASPDTPLFLGSTAVQGDWTWGLPPLLAHARFADHPAPDRSPRGLIGLACVGGPDAGGWTAIVPPGVLVGRGAAADLQLEDPQLSRAHFRILLRDNHFLLVDISSTNGIEIDGEPVVGSAVVTPGQLIHAGGSLLRIGPALDFPASVRPDGCGRLLVVRPPRAVPSWIEQVFTRPGPPPLPPRRTLPWLPSAVGMALSAAVAVLTGMWMFLLLAVVGPLMMFATALGDRVTGLRQYRRDHAEHTLLEAETQRSLQVAAAAEQSHLWDLHPDPATVLSRAAGRSCLLWERRPADQDWLQLRLGVGPQPSRIGVPTPPELRYAPLVVDLLRERVVGVHTSSDTLIRALLIQLAVLHSPADLELWIFSADRRDRRWADLPHVRAVVCPGDDSSASAAWQELARTSGSSRVVIVKNWPDSSEVVTSTARIVDPRTAVICQTTDRRDLPPGCAAVVTAPAPEGDVDTVELIGSTRTGRGAVDGIGTGACRELIADLAPLVDQVVGFAPDLPQRIDLLSLLPGVDDPSEGGDPLPPGGPTSGRQVIDPWLSRRWQHPTPRATIGRSRCGPVELDLDRDGPHFLVAGTTGSGKSELLTAIVLGLALAVPPTELNVLLIDYKGGSAFADATGLPHIAGFVTDLDPMTAERALCSLRAELRTRERVLAASGHQDLAERRSAAPAGCPPRLVVVIDEFATLAGDLPGFMDGLLDIAQRGRSLGVHLVLATQRPTGVVSPAIKANITGRICLRVTDPADSVDVIDTAAAAEISPDQPGRAYLRTGPGGPVLFQAAAVRQPPPLRSGAPVVVLRPHDPRPPGPTPVATLTERCRTAATGLPAARCPWLPPLPDRYQPIDDPADGAGVLGLLDLPEEQAQRPLGLPVGHLLVVGPAGSGRSTALRSAAAATGADTELIVLDPTRGLGGLARRQRCSTYLDAGEPALALRALELLRQRVDSGTASPAMVLIDTWDSLLRILDPDPAPAVQLLAEIAARGTAAGVQLVVAGTRGLLHGSLAGAFPSVLELGPPDRAAAHAVPPGRAVWQQHQVQIRWPPDDVASPTTTVHAHATVVRPLPVRAFADRMPADPPGHVLLGIGGDRAEPILLPIRAGGALLVLGRRGSGVTTTVEGLGMRAATSGHHVVSGVFREPRHPAEVDLRHGSAAFERRLAESDGPVLVLVDDAQRYQSHPVGAVLETFLADLRPGHYLVLGTRPDDLARTFRGFLAEAAAFRHAVLLHPDPLEGRAFDVALPRRAGILRPGRGFHCRHGEAVPIQIVGPPTGSVVHNSEETA